MEEGRRWVVVLVVVLLVLRSRERRPSWQCGGRRRAKIADKSGHWKPWGGGKRVFMVIATSQTYLDTSVFLSNLDIVKMVLDRRSWEFRAGSKLTFWLVVPHTAGSGSPDPHALASS
jgi:hypothetical protein